MAIKIDMNKAYDRVEQNMVVNIMRKCGFNENWRNWIVSYMSYVSYRVLVNGSLGPPIIPSHGLKQGDPISSFLFLLCSECLSASLVAKERLGAISGIKIKPSNLPISHLMFADDCYNFSKVNMNEIGAIIETLSKFSLSSGQIINHNKSDLYFSPNTLRQFKKLIQNAFQIKQNPNLRNCLDLLSFIGRSKENLFAFINAREIFFILSRKRNPPKIGGYCHPLVCYVLFHSPQKDL